MCHLIDLFIIYNWIFGIFKGEQGEVGPPGDAGDEGPAVSRFWSNIYTVCLLVSGMTTNFIFLYYLSACPIVYSNTVIRNV